MTQNLNFFVRNAADVETNIVAVERIKEYTELKQVRNRLHKHNLLFTIISVVTTFQPSKRVFSYEYLLICRKDAYLTIWIYKLIKNVNI